MSPPGRPKGEYRSAQRSSDAAPHLGLPSGDAAVHSARWYRVATLAPRLLPSLQLQRQRLRGQTWFVLSSRGGGRRLRLNAAAWALAARLDGTLTLQQLWDLALAQHDDPPTQDELIDLLAQLREAGLLQLDQAADLAHWLPHVQQLARPPRRNNLLAWRVPLANPAAALARLAPLGRALFSTPAALAYGLVLAATGLQALLHAPALLAHGQKWLATPTYLVLALLLYLPIKLVHELAHGLALQRWGAPVPQAGVTLMLGWPLPWVDASATASLPLRRQRVAVGAAGMVAEWGLAAMALPLWLHLPDGLARDAAFVTLFLTGVSTLLFNANPLQRLDGYYIASDLLDLPNLAPRSRQWWLAQLHTRLLRSSHPRRAGMAPAGAPSAAAAAPDPRGTAGLPWGHTDSMVLARGEAPWLAAYAPLSWAYGLLVAALAVLWLGSVSALLGAVAALLLGWQLGLRPVWGLLSTLRQQALAQQHSHRRWQRLGLASGALLATLALLPLPQRSLVQGVVWPPEQAQLRAEEAGFVQRLHVADGQWVAAGTLVANLANPGLLTRWQSQQARVAALEAELNAALPANTDAPARLDSGAPRLAGDASAELAQAEAELARLQQRLANLALRAQVAGRLSLPQPADLAGRYLQRGQLLGQVVGDDAPTVRVALPESDAHTLRQASPSISVRLAANPGQAHGARLLGDAGGAQHQLPSAALSQRRGGGVATDPQDADDLKALNPVLLFDLQLSQPPQPAARLGERAWVRLETGWAPLGWQLLQGLRRGLLARLNPQF